MQHRDALQQLTHDRQARLRQEAVDERLARETRARRTAQRRRLRIHVALDLLHRGRVERA